MLLLCDISLLSKLTTYFQPADDFPTLTMCQHQTCSNCFRQYLKVEISESRYIDMLTLVLILGRVVKILLNQNF